MKGVVRRRWLCIRRNVSLLMGFMIPVCAWAAPDFNGIWQLQDHSKVFRLRTPGELPLKAEAARVFAQRRAAQMAKEFSWDSASRCIPLGVPRALGAQRPFEILQEPNTLTVLFEVQRLYRKVYLDPAAPVNDDATFMGLSMGRWDGDTLVIETRNFKEGTSLDDVGLPHSDALKLTERWRLTNSRTLVDEIRVEDEKTFTRPWQTTLVFSKLTGVQIKEDICVNRIGSEGQAQRP